MDYPSTSRHRKPCIQTPWCAPGFSIRAPCQALWPQGVHAWGAPVACTQKACASQTRLATKLGSTFVALELLCTALSRPVFAANIFAARAKPGPCSRCHGVSSLRKRTCIRHLCAWCPDVYQGCNNCVAIHAGLRRDCLKAPCSLCKVHMPRRCCCALQSSLTSTDTMATSSADMQSGKETHYNPKNDVILRSACQMSLVAVLGSGVYRTHQG